MAIRSAGMVIACDGSAAADNASPAYCGTIPALA
jgi:hypothetical protein